MSFENKVVIVTGSGSGIGEATAKLFAKEKAKVVIVGRTEAKLRSVADDIKAAVGIEPFIIKADVSNDDEARSIVDKTVEHFGKLDVLVNNAGISASILIKDQGYIEDFDKVYATNLRGIAVITHAAVPYLIKTKGNIVNVSSVLSTTVAPKNSAYASAKAALDHFTRCIALELAHDGVRVNTVNPGPVITEITIPIGISKEQMRQIAMGNPIGHITESEEIGEMILYLASDKAVSITGSSFLIDSGVKLIGLINMSRNRISN